MCRSIWNIRKLIYNGVPAVDGSCNDTGEASQLANTSGINNSSYSPADVGYMYGDRYTAASRDLSSQTDTYIYGNDVSWDGKNYTLIDTIESSNWENDRKDLAKKYHYACFSTTNTCTSVYYIHFFGNPSRSYYLKLTNDKNIEDAKEEMFTNTTNSTIKTSIDNWYSTNMIGYTSKLEDTVWCNDREFYMGSLKNKDTDATTDNSYFNAYRRNANSAELSLSCLNIRDSFTVNGVIGNGKLTYPVGLLTADEITLAGGGVSGYNLNAYLNTGQCWWSMSPSFFTGAYSIHFTLYSSGSLSQSPSGYVFGVRPSVSLKAGTKLSGRQELLMIHI